MNIFNIFKFSRQLIILAFCLSIITGILLQQFFIKKFHTKIFSCEQEQELLTERFNNKLDKLNKQLVLLKEENRNIKIYNQDLEHRIAEFQYVQYDTAQKLDQVNNEKVESEKNYLAESSLLQNKIKNLRKENTDLHALIKELQAQIKNYKVNSYGLFQAGKLETELSNVDQQLTEHYENIAHKKSNAAILKDKCGKLRTNIKFCKEYEATLENINLFEKQLEHLQHKREDLKHRINVYLASSSQTNPR